MPVRVSNPEDTTTMRTLRLTKRSGRLEPFDRRKLIESIVRSGGNYRIAHDVLAELVFRQGMTTDELRREVVGCLQKTDPVLAQRYKYTHTLWAHSHPALAGDSAYLNPETITQLGIDSGHYVQVLHGNRRHSVPVEPSNDVPLRQVRLLPQTLELLHAPIGVRVAIKC